MHNKTSGMCGRCGYDLSGIRSGRCPECDWSIVDSTEYEKEKPVQDTGIYGEPFGADLDAFDTLFAAVPAAALAALVYITRAPSGASVVLGTLVSVCVATAACGVALIMMGDKLEGGWRLLGEVAAGIVAGVAFLLLLCSAMWGL
ncbi:MAG: hypothetical protein KF745_12685 [Phycisphaeraceae bacterium]|nr:hypothetical protein [Phycisphaeraceae bacterium]